MRVLAATLGVAAAVSVAENVTPVQKVIQLLNGMLEKGKKERQAEQVQFSTYKQFCGDTEGEKTRAIGMADDHIEQLTAAIQKHNAEADRLMDEVKDHEDDVNCWTGDDKAANSVRAIERADYLAMHKDYSESVDALTRAIAVLKKQNYDRKQGADALMQVKQKSLIPASAKKVIDTFLQSGENPLDVTAPEANAYEFQSGGVINMLENLKDKFTDERVTLEKEESKSKHAFNILIQELTNGIAEGKHQISIKSQERAENQAAAAQAEGDKADTTNSRNDDQAYLDDLVATCKTKQADFDSRQELRADEIEAIEKAIDIMGSNDVSGNAGKYLPGLVQTSFLQITQEVTNPNQVRVAQFLSDRAEAIHSHVLSALAVRAEANPFSKVKKMIQDLITRLREEATQEAEHKGWCDKELAQNKHIRDAKTSSVEKLHAEVDELTARIAKLTREIAELGTQIADLNTAVAKATKIRKDEKYENGVTIKESKEAQTAVAKALTVLKTFYDKAGGATALVQAPADAPDIFEKPYTGMQGENGGVIGMMEVIESDFARLEAETKASEASQTAEFDKFMTDSKVDIRSKETDVKHKTAQNAEADRNLNLAKDDLKQTQKDLDAALEYFDKLKPSCVNADVSYEDRVKRREEELESLKEALEILGQPDLSP